jgi:hypothetical protein
VIYPPEFSVAPNIFGAPLIFNIFIALLLQVRTAFISWKDTTKIDARHLKTINSAQNNGKN